MAKKLSTTKSDLKRLDAMTDEDIDYSDIPPTTDEEWARAEVFIGGKQAVSLRLDPDVVAFFKEQGKGYQTAMNRVLRQYMEAHKSKRKAAGVRKTSKKAG
jgi:uncharacterized protein (DUF4415 family)